MGAEGIGQRIKGGEGGGRGWGRGRKTRSYGVNRTEGADLLPGRTEEKRCRGCQCLGVGSLLSWPPIAWSSPSLGGFAEEILKDRPGGLLEAVKPSVQGLDNLVDVTKLDVASCLSISKSSRNFGMTGTDRWWSADGNRVWTRGVGAGARGCWQPKLRGGLYTKEGTSWSW